MKLLFTKKNITIFCVILLLILIGKNFFLKTTNVDEEKKQVLTMVSIRSLNDEVYKGKTLEFLGTVKASDSLYLVPESSGRISSIYVKEGSTVKKGQTIAVIDDVNERLAYQRALTQRESQEIVLNNLKKEFNKHDNSTFSLIVTQQEEKVRSAYQAFLNNDLRAYPFGKDPESVDALAPVISGTYQGTTEGQYIIEMYRSAAPSGYSLRVSGLENGVYSASTHFPTPLGEKGLFLQFPTSAQGNIKEQKWVIDIPNKRSSTYLNAKNTYEATQSGKDLTLTQSQVTEDDIKQQENIVRQMNLAVQEASLALSKKLIKAPFDGELTELGVRIGDLVSPSQIIGSVKDLHTLEVEFFVSPEEASMFSLETPLVIDDNEIGKVSFIASTLDENGMIRVKANLHSQSFTEGSSLRFSLLIDNSVYSENNSLLIPLTALQMQANKPFVLYVGSDNRIELIPVRTGLLFGDMIEVILSKDIPHFVLDARGLRGGQKVIITK